MLNTHVESFVKRFVAQQARPKRLRRSGALTYHYCRHCGTHTDTLPKAPSRAAITICKPCEALDEQGLVEDALERALSSRENYLVSLEGFA